MNKPIVLEYMNGYRMVHDGEPIHEDDLAFGYLDDGTYGWGRLPRWMVTQPYLEGAAGWPRIVVRRIKE